MYKKTKTRKEKDFLCSCSSTPKILPEDSSSSPNSISTSKRFSPSITRLLLHSFPSIKYLSVSSYVVLVLVLTRPYTFQRMYKKKKKEISHTRLEKATLSTYDISQKRIRRRVGWARELKIILCIIKSDCKGNFQIKYVKYKLNLFIHLSIIAQERSLNPKLDEQNLM